MYLGLGVLLLQGLQPVALFGQVLDLVLVLRQTALSNLLLVHLLDLQLGVVIPLLQLVIFVLEGLQLVRGLRLLLLGGHALLETLVPADLGQSFIKKEPFHLLSQQRDPRLVLPNLLVLEPRLLDRRFQLRNFLLLLVVLAVFAFQRVVQRLDV